MACNHPLSAWYTKHPNDNNRHPVTFTFTGADTSRPVGVRCGRCIGCRLDWAREWGIRMVHEHHTVETTNPGTSYFATFTYDEANLPWSPTSGTATLRPADFTNFMKRLRFHQAERRKRAGLEPVTIRYFQGGEYGERTERPHHHAILYNLDLDDLELLSTHTHGSARARLYRSSTVEDLWSHGHVRLATNVKLEATRYVAAYVTKKRWSASPEELERHYHGRVREYHTMSRRPGLGAAFWQTYNSDIRNLGGIALPGRATPLPIPRYYLDKWRETGEDDFAAYAAENEARRVTRTGRQLIATEQKHAANARTFKREPTE